MRRAFSVIDLAKLEGFIAGHRRTVTLREFAAGDRDPDAVAIRHDIDHDAANAVRFAEWERSHGFTASYYMLPTADYWRRHAREASLRIQDLGHEVGLHNDAYCAAEGNIAKALQLLREWTEEMRSWGVDVVGCADHGGSGYANTDIWRVLGHTPEEVGLQYEAYLLHRQETNYVSDNRGTWRAPMRRVDGRQTHILCHPEHWPVDQVAFSLDEVAA